MSQLVQRQILRLDDLLDFLARLSGVPVGATTSTSRPESDPGFAGDNGGFTERMWPCGCSLTVSVSLPYGGMNTPTDMEIVWLVTACDEHREG